MGVLDGIFVEFLGGFSILLNCFPERLLELGRGHRATDFLRGLVLGPVLGGQQLSHPLHEVGVGQQGAHRLRGQAHRQVHGRPPGSSSRHLIGAFQAGQDVL